MNQIFHILNGDALKEQFPAAIPGEIIIARLCLVDGPVAAATESELYKIHAAFICEVYPGFSEKECLNSIVSEMQKVEEIPGDSTVNLWFEDDLFCQVNFWFMMHLLSQKGKKYQLNLVRPKKGAEYSFGAMNQGELVQAIDNKIVIASDEQISLSRFWRLYQQNKLSELIRLSELLSDRYPFLLPAVRAHQDRCVQPGRPKQAIRAIMEELQTEEFGPVFRAFCQREKIYGYGDLQVKRLFDEVLKERSGNDADLLDFPG